MIFATRLFSALPRRRADAGHSRPSTHHGLTRRHTREIEGKQTGLVDVHGDRLHHGVVVPGGFPEIELGDHGVTVDRHVEQASPLPLGPARRKRLVAVAGDDRLVPEAGQHVAQHGAHRRFILEHQHAGR